MRLVTSTWRVGGWAGWWAGGGWVDWAGGRAGQGPATCRRGSASRGLGPAPGRPQPTVPPHHAGCKVARLAACTAAEEPAPSTAHPPTRQQPHPAGPHLHAHKLDDAPHLVLDGRHRQQVPEGRAVLAVCMGGRRADGRRARRCESADEWGRAVRAVGTAGARAEARQQPASIGDTAARERPAARQRRQQQRHQQQPSSRSGRPGPPTSSPGSPRAQLSRRVHTLVPFFTASRSFLTSLGSVPSPWRKRLRAPARGASRGARGGQRRQGRAAPCLRRRANQLPSTELPPGSGWHGRRRAARPRPERRSPSIPAGRSACNATAGCRGLGACSPVVPQHLLHTVSSHVHKPARVKSRWRPRRHAQAQAGGCRQAGGRRSSAPAAAAADTAAAASPLAGIDEGAVRQRRIGHDDCISNRQQRAGEVKRR